MSNRRPKIGKNTHMTNPLTTPDTDTEATVLIGTNEGVRTIQLHRPAAFNSFDTSMKRSLLTALREATDDDAVRVIMLIGTGRAFCAGQDLKEHLGRVNANDPVVADTVTEFYNPLIMAVTEARKPVIAAVNGVAAGAGAALAFACDLRLAAPSASFAMAFAQVALSADSGASFTLPRLVGRGRALHMMLTGEKVGASEALRIGLVDDVAPEDGDAFAEYAAARAMRLAAGPAAALSWIKASVTYAATHTLAESLAFENEAQRSCFASQDHREALAAFVEKRTPQFNRVNRV